MQSITPSAKDKILFYLRDNSPLEQLVYITTKDFLSATETNSETARAILYQFQRFGFLTDLGVGQENICFVLQTDLHDFAQKGGFIIQEEIFKANIEKLGFEIDNLKKQLGPDHLDAVNKISSIASALFGGLSLLPH